MSYNVTDIETRPLFLALSSSLLTTLSRAVFRGLFHVPCLEAYFTCRVSRPISRAVFGGLFHVPCLEAYFTCRVSTQGRCHFCPWLSEFSSAVVLNCSRLSRSTIFADASLVKPPEDSFNPLFKAILYSVSWVRKLVSSPVNRHRIDKRDDEARRDR